MVKVYDKKRTLNEIITAVGQYSINLNHYKNENWENGVLIDGLLFNARPEYQDTVLSIVNHAVATQDSDGQLAFSLIIPGDPGDAVGRWSGRSTITGTVHSTPLGRGVLWAYKHTGDKRYLEAAQRQWEYYKKVERTSNGAFVHREEAPELWLDTVWFICPFFAEYGKITGDTSATQEAVRQIVTHAECLQENNGLFRHVWCERPNYFPQSKYWARGMGWVTAAIVDVWEQLSPEDASREQIGKILLDCLEALLKYQDTSGFWRNILDDRHESLEASGTAMFAYSIKKGLDLGIFQGMRFEEAAKRAMNAISAVVQPNGAVGMVALPPGGPNARIGTTTYGQGWFLQAASRFN
ncbi:glycosyl hydrolase family 88 [Bacillus sp. M6-12]|uniref:glycoside hydrolase family 88 protein n=1 Tax=Bacillus sp. M6-12 TaxID=2054166 RepID=UPI000C767AD6|nr:glycoside hydrolase family 88 protein [Bacillus sp. M6-12]PLS16135.1 glycosyl hydrolase family 88 [Bacillus sp. M6-12]